LTSSQSAIPDRVGDLAIVLHSHMPYVEGFGTYPFGEEWLFESFARSHLPVMDICHDLTVTVTPVLADQLETPGVAERMRGFLIEHRLEAAERDAAEAEPELRLAARAEVDRYGEAVRRLHELDGDLLAAFRAACGQGVELMPSAATHAILPLLATVAGQRLQMDAGLRSHRRRFGWRGGFWLPECAYRPGLELRLAEFGVGHFCLVQSGRQSEPDSLAPVATAAGPTAFTIDWPAVELVWSDRGYPADAAYLEYHRQSENGIRLWAIGGEPYDPAAAKARAAGHAAEFVDAMVERLSRFSSERREPGLVVFAVDTELLGDWWSEGPAWLAEVLRLAPQRGIGLLTLSAALDGHEPRQRSLHESSWGAGNDLSTWDSPQVADLAWGARRMELRLLRALNQGAEAVAAERAARELLAVQSSDWAFMDKRGRAGDYPFRRATAHAQRLLDALDSASPPDPRLRNLAPDLSLSPLLSP
jgi:1,4-alpha-glucan branching enzyme